MSAARPPPVVHPAPPTSDPGPIGKRVPSDRHPSNADAVGLYRAMITSRRIERRVIELYRQGIVTGGCYTGIGNEATSVATAWPLAEHDVLVPTHRDMGSHVVRGHTPLQIMQQYLKRATGATRGKDSSLHMGAEGSNIVGMISHLAHMAPVAVGVALAERQLGRNSCVLTTVGDGATSLGDFHEALNFAAVQKLPVLFVIVNNQYAYSTPVSLQYACDKLSDRAMGYGMPGETVDGTDAIEVYDAARRAYTRARRGEGPTLIESVTMRARGHSEHDDFKYVPSDLLEAWWRWDPIERFERYLEEHHVLTADERRSVGEDIDTEIERAIDIARADPMPKPESGGEGVFRHWAPEWTVPSGEDWELDS
ncbi:MAG: thiamine pyrophosphate-dependent dehydrogenase E1 component subunit alpha [Deltaproteobacteria bacterium]